MIFQKDEPIATDHLPEKKSDRLKAKAKRRVEKQQLKGNSPTSSIDMGYSTDTAVGKKRAHSKRVSFEKVEARDMLLVKKRKLDLTSKSMSCVHGIDKELIQDAPTFEEVRKHIC